MSSGGLQQAHSRDVPMIFSHPAHHVEPAAGTTTASEAVADAHAAQPCVQAAGPISGAQAARMAPAARGVVACEGKYLNTAVRIALSKPQMAEGLLQLLFALAGRCSATHVVFMQLSEPHRAQLSATDTTAPTAVVLLTARGVKLGDYSEGKEQPPRARLQLHLFSTTSVHHLPCVCSQAGRLATNQAALALVRNLDVRVGSQRRNGPSFGQTSLHPSVPRLQGCSHVTTCHMLNGSRRCSLHSTLMTGTPRFAQS